MSTRQTAISACVDQDIAFSRPTLTAQVRLQPLQTVTAVCSANVLSVTITESDIRPITFQNICSVDALPLFNSIHFSLFLIFKVKRFVVVFLYFLILFE